MKKTILFLILISFAAFAQNKEKENWDFTFDATQTTSSDKNEVKEKKGDTNKDNDDDKEDSEDKEEVNKTEDEGMDFSNVKLESDSLDEDIENQEEKEIDEELKKEKKPQIDIKKVKEEERLKKQKKEMFLSFLKMQIKTNYRNLMLFENLPYSHSFGLEITTSLMGLELKNANAYIGEIGYRLAHNFEVAHILVISPLMLNFNFRKYGEVFPVEINLFKMYFFQKTIRGNNGKNLNAFFEYVSVSFSWRLLKTDRFESSLFLGVSFGPDDINSNPQRESVVFTLGIKGDFLPFKINF